MIDNMAKVYALLAPIGVTYSCPVLDSYPNSITAFPCITFMDVDHSDGNYADGKASADLVQIKVDIWERPDPLTGVTSSPHVAVDLAFGADGNWYDAGFQHLIEPDTGVHHYVQTYGIVESQ